MRFVEPVMHIFLFITLILNIKSQFSWQSWDEFDTVSSQLTKVNEENCNILQTRELYLSKDSISHLPDIKDVNINPILPNRTSLLYIHNLALSRGFFYSFILQKAFDNDEPGIMYYYLSSVADVSSDPRVNASAIYFSYNKSFTPSYKAFFNKTMPLFAPRVYRSDDYNDPQHLERISTLNTIEAHDLGAIPFNSRSLNYTNDEYRINDWYRKWLPDDVKRHDTKTVYQIRIRYANNTNETFTWHGPPGADEIPGPVNWTLPYFDCGRSNKWILGAVVPIVDIYPRHTGFRHIEYPNYVATSVVELDFDRIDINQCPLGEGNTGPNRFAGTSRCKDTTECEPLHGWGFRRGGYMCPCKPGYRLPNIVRSPYLGEIVERTSKEDYIDAFTCDRIGHIMVMPLSWGIMDPVLRHKYLDSANVNLTIDPMAKLSIYDKVDSIFDFMERVRMGNCSDRSRFSEDELILGGDVAYGAEKQFENEARLALRLANFISSFLQVVDSNDLFSELRVADKPLTEDQIMGETLSLLLGDTKIWGAGVFWDRNKFGNKALFAPYAYKKRLNTRKFFMEDLAWITDSERMYVNQPWFREIKSRFSTNFDDLDEIFLKMHMRFNASGLFERKYEHYPTKYYAANIHHGEWTRPYFDCNGFHKNWIISYSAPFFGWDSLKDKLEFKGAVKVAMNMDALDINQCPDESWVPNAFKDSHKCDRKSSYCVPIQGRGFFKGGYKCMCRQGYEYPYENPTTGYDGQLVEAEFQNLKENKPTRYDTLKCRLSSAPCSRTTTFFFIFPVLVALIYF